jgi:hypothetical protein
LPLTLQKTHCAGGLGGEKTHYGEAREATKVTEYGKAWDLKVAECFLTHYQFSESPQLPHNHNLEHPELTYLTLAIDLIRGSPFHVTFSNPVPRVYTCVNTTEMQIKT